MRRLVVLLVAGSLGATLAGCSGDDNTTPSPTSSPVICASATPGGMFGYSPVVTFASSSQSLFVEMADDGAERSLGLMNRACLESNSGMLFVYPNDVQNTFWMKNTLIPLSIAWMKADGTILEIEDMRPQTDDQHSAPAPFRYAIEANQGWFTEHGISAGDRATIPPNLSAS